MFKHLNIGLDSAFLRIVIVIAVLLPFQFSSCISPDPTSDPVVKVLVADQVGTGIIVQKTGYVVASEHFVHGQKKVEITLKSGTTYEGDVVCRNMATDIAIIKLIGDSLSLPYATIGNSDLASEMEDIVVSISSANTKAAAVFTGKLLVIRKNNDITYLQTNAYSSPDSSGSPMFNKAGELIGMITWNPDNSEGTVIAIASNDIMPFVTEILCSGCEKIKIEKTGIESVFSSSAAITWATNKAASGWIEYGTTEKYGLSTGISSDLVNEDAAVIQQLSPNTTYHFRIRAVDLCGNEAVSADQTITTTKDASAGEDLSILSINIVDVKSNTATVIWVTNKPSNSAVSYGTSSMDKSGSQSSKSMIIEHRIKIDDLIPETRYYIDVESTSASGESIKGSAAAFKTQSVTRACCKANCRMPDFVLQSLDGTDFTLDNISGRKAVIIFAKTGCSTCMAQAIYLNDIYKETPPGSTQYCVVFNNEKKEDVIAWKNKYGIEVPVYLDLKGDLVNYCMFRTIPTTLIIDSSGKIIHQQEGAFGSKKVLEDILKSF